MTLAQVEQKLTRLEREVTNLKRAQNGNSRTKIRDGKSWVANAGAFADDPGYTEMVRLGRQYRQSLKPKSGTRKTGKRSR